MAGKHRKGRPPQQRRRTVEMVDITTGTAHFLTLAAVENGRSGGRYTTLCAETIMPAALIAREARYCRLCVPVPAQRSR